MERVLPEPGGVERKKGPISDRPLSGWRVGKALLAVLPLVPTLVELVHEALSGGGLPPSG